MIVMTLIMWRNNCFL